MEKTLKWRLEDAQRMLPTFHETSLIALAYYGFVLVRPNITEYRSLIPLATEEVLQEWKKSLRAEGLTDTEITEYGYGGEAHTYVKTKLD